MENKSKDKELNPADDHIRSLTDISRFENDATKNTETGENQTPDADDLKSQEESSSIGGQGLYRSTKGSSKKGKFAAVLKKKGPAGGIIGILLLGLVGIGGGMLIPSTLIVHLKETMVGKFNYQIGSADMRTNKLYKTKIDGTTNVTCKIKVKCRYSTVSNKQVARFTSAGIDVTTEDASFGRKKITSMSFIEDGKTIKVAAKDFSSTYGSNANFRKAVNTAYSPKFAGFSDAIWSKFKAKVSLSERAPKAAETDEERARNLQEYARSGASDLPSVGDKIDPKCEKDCDTYKQADIERLKADLDAPKATLEIAKVSSLASKGALNTLKITGIIDNTCMAYGLFQTVSYGAKAVRSLQLIRYAGYFMMLADMIKAGDAKPEDVTFAGNILTSVAKDAETGENRGAATDSFGYKYAAYGDVSKQSNYTAQFLAGGGLTGELITASATVGELVSRVGGTTICKVLSNWFVSIGTVVAGVAAGLFTGGGSIAAQTAIMATSAAALIGAMYVLPPMIEDIIAGTVTKGIVGEDSGDAITSGAGAMMGGVASLGGNAPMSVEQAMAYTNLQQQTTIAYLKDEAADLSMFDTSNRFTFMGSLAYSLSPLASNTSSFGSFFSSLVKIPSLSIASIMPKASAVSDADLRASMTMCQDYVISDMKIAADPFCNPIYGIPPTYLDRDPIDAIDNLFSKGYLKLNTAGDDYEQTDLYKKWISTCIDRSEPMGSTGSSFDQDPGWECKIDNQLKADIYIHYIDERIDTGMDGYDATSPEIGFTTNSLRFA